METKHKEFKPFDKVLVRTDFYPKWSVDYYSHYDYKINFHETIGAVVKKDDDILPYEGNEHLVGTTNVPEEEVKLEEGECLMCSHTPNVRVCSWCLRKYIKTTDSGFYVDDAITATQVLTYAIRFSDFNPNDMEETLKHILCVKNGKILRYKC